jgi:hypothetical protein
MFKIDRSGKRIDKKEGIKRTLIEGSIGRGSKPVNRKRKQRSYPIWASLTRPIRSRSTETARGSTRRGEKGP